MNGLAVFPQLVVRHMAPSDGDRLRRLFDRLSPDTVYRRFFTLFPAPPAAWRRAWPAPQLSSWTGP